MIRLKHLHLKNFITLTLLTATLLTLTRCGSNTGSNTDPTPGTFTSVYSILKSNNCTECHVPGGAGTIAGAKLDFTSQATAYSTLISSTVSGSTGITDCSGVKIVSPGSPSTSYLMAVLFSSYSVANFADKSGCTPYNGDLIKINLSPSDQSSISQWIQNGAFNN